jgi:hypothetical protein
LCIAIFLISTSWVAGITGMATTPGSFFVYLRLTVAYSPITSNLLPISMADSSTLTTETTTTEDQTYPLLLCL